MKRQQIISNKLNTHVRIEEVVNLILVLNRQILTNQEMVKRIMPSFVAASSKSNSTRTNETPRGLYFV